MGNFCSMRWDSSQDHEMAQMGYRSPVEVRGSLMEGSPSPDHKGDRLGTTQSQDGRDYDPLPRAGESSGNVGF